MVLYDEYFQEIIFNKRFQRVYICSISESGMFLFLVSFCVKFDLVRLKIVENGGYPFYAVTCFNLTFFVLLIPFFVHFTHTFIV